jgi:transposase
MPTHRYRSVFERLDEKSRALIQSYLDDPSDKTWRAASSVVLNTLHSFFLYA